jgi:hypothetical protein
VLAARVPSLRGAVAGHCLRDRRSHDGVGDSGVVRLGRWCNAGRKLASRRKRKSPGRRVGALPDGKAGGWGALGYSRPSIQPAPPYPVPATTDG